MLERYGIVPGQDGSTIDVPRAIAQVQTELVSVFGFQPHTGVIQFLENPESGALLQRVLAGRGISAGETERTIEAYTVGKRTGAAYVGDLDVGLQPKPDYIVFVHRTTRIMQFPFFLAEEITHGEHMATVIDRHGITYSQYRSRFHELTDEFLGYLGRKRVVSMAGLTGNYATTVAYEEPMEESHIIHLIAYYAVDTVIESGHTIPEADLFHAPDEQTFWSILHASVGEGIRLNFTFPPMLRFEHKFSPRVRELLHEAHADRVISITFSYQE